MMNHILIDILKKLSYNLTDTINTTLQSHILTTLTNLSHDIHTIKHDLYQHMSNQLNQSKREYIDDIKIILSQTSMSDIDKTQSILDKNSEWLLTKMNLLLNDIVPNHNEKFYQQFESSIQQLHSSLNNETKQLMQHYNQDDKVIKNHFDNIDIQFNKMFQQLQQQVFTFIQSSDDRTQNSFQQIRERISMNDEVFSGLSVFLNKYKYNSTVKGSVSESELYSILQKIFPYDNILDHRSEPASCDYEVIRLNESLPNILFENKDYQRTISTDEVQKFQRDLQIHKKHGIFVSQNSPITFKKPFQIDIIDHIIHIYIPNLQYNEEKLQIAVHMIDSWHPKSKKSNPIPIFLIKPLFYKIMI
jgi:hypothetical protein